MTGDDDPNPNESDIGKIKVSVIETDTSFDSTVEPTKSSLPVDCVVKKLTENSTTEDFRITRSKSRQTGGKVLLPATSKEATKSSLSNDERRVKILLTKYDAKEPSERVQPCEPSTSTASKSRQMDKMISLPGTSKGATKSSLSNAERVIKILSTKYHAKKPSERVQSCGPSTASKRKAIATNTDEINAKRRKLGEPTTDSFVNQNESTTNDKRSTDADTQPETTDAKNMVVMTLPFKIGEVVWGKIRGWPHWPAKIMRIYPQQYEVEWFNDFRRTKLYRSQIYKFAFNFDLFSEKFDTTVGLREAAEQAMIEVIKLRQMP